MNSFNSPSPPRGTSTLFAVTQARGRRKSGSVAVPPGAGAPVPAAVENNADGRRSSSDSPELSHLRFVRRPASPLPPKPPASRKKHLQQQLPSPAHTAALSPADSTDSGILGEGSRRGGRSLSGEDGREGCFRVLEKGGGMVGVQGGRGCRLSPLSTRGLVDGKKR